MAASSGAVGVYIVPLAHQAGLTSFVGTLGTALGDDHVLGLRRLADRVVLIFDGDEAGQKAADRSLELFLGHDMDVRVLTLPQDLDPCDFLLKEGGDAFAALIEDMDCEVVFAKGTVKLDAARQYGWDLKLTAYNNLGPEVTAIESMVRTQGQPTNR